MKKLISFILVLSLVFGGCASLHPVPVPQNVPARSLELNPLTLKREWREPVPMTPKEDAQLRAELAAKDPAFSRSEPVLHYKIYKTPDSHSDRVATAEIYEIRSHDGLRRRMKRIDLKGVPQYAEIDKIKSKK